MTSLFQRVLLSCFAWFTLVSATDVVTKIHYHTFMAKGGDAISTVLSRYELQGNEANFQEFLRINKLKPNSFLMAKKEYKLPIKIYKYDGKSIRSTIGNADYEKAVRIQKYNEALEQKGLKKSSFTKDLKLWVPYHELVESSEADSSATLKESDPASKENKVVLETKSSPKAGKTVKYPLFGSNYAEVEVEDNTLAGQVFYIISGHGGPDPGTQYKRTPSTMCEDEYAYDVSLRLARDLMQHGAIVHMIIQDKNDGIRDDSYLDCDKDEVNLKGNRLPLRQLDRLKQRTDAVNILYEKYRRKGVKTQKLIEIHIDARGEEQRQDVYFYYSAQSKASKKLAENVMETFEQKYDKHQKDRGYQGYVVERGLYTLRKARPSAVYVELANIKNTEDHKRLIINSNRQALANWLFEGLTK